ncbi:hornerin isoform X2 [Drosophila tropicalis]|uniref:hornerin isoform X2 n=1 Tax=Drosophila tropicalis TaxID=46794 RepID=UPI0035ABDB95
MATINDVSEDANSLSRHDCLNACTAAADNDDDDEDERRTMRPMDSYEDICQTLRTNISSDELVKPTISVSTIKMEENPSSSSSIPAASATAAILPPVEIENCRPSCSAKTNPDDEYNEFLKNMNSRYSQYQSIAEPIGGYLSQDYGYGANLSCESNIYGQQNQMDGTSYYGGYAQQAAGAMPQNPSCYNYSLAPIQQQQQQHQQQQHQEHQQQRHSTPENGMYTYMQSQSMHMTQTNDKESTTSPKSPTMTTNSTPTQSYSNDSCCFFPRRTESQAGQQCGQEYGQSQGMPMGIGSMGMAGGGGGAPMYYHATGGGAAANTGMFAMNMNGGASLFNMTTRQQSVPSASGGFPSMAMGHGFPGDIESFMSKFNQSAAQQCFPQGMGMPMPMPFPMPMQMPCFPMNDAINSVNSMGNPMSSWGQLQAHGLGQGYANDTLQTQTVYASDYKPFAGMGNNFNHFPNGGPNGSLGLLSATDSATSYGVGVAGGGSGASTLAELYGGGGGMVSGVGQAIYGMSDQLQGFPLSQMSAMSPAMGQMSAMSYSSYPYAANCDGMPGMASNGGESHMQSIGMCGGLNTKAGS